MKAVLFTQFGQRPTLEDLPAPEPSANGVVIKVKATGVCRSDWHGWMGHDPDITLPHVPGHEFAGIVEATGKNVTRFKPGDPVTVPFVSGCGTCGECRSGNQQVCENQSQPGFTHWGSFAEYVAVHHADMNLIQLPETLNFATAASLGCRFSTSFRAVIDQGRIQAGQWLAVHGCGGVGLSAIMIASAAGAYVVAIDIDDKKLERARNVGAAACINAANTKDVASAVADLSLGGAHVSLDALGHPITCANSIRCLRRRGKHIQVGLLLADLSTPPIPMDLVVAKELEIIGSHGMQAHRFTKMMDMIHSGRLAPERLLGGEIRLEQSIDALIGMDDFVHSGIIVVTRF